MILRWRCWANVGKCGEDGMGMSGFEGGPARGKLVLVIDGWE